MCEWLMFIWLVLGCGGCDGNNPAMLYVGREIPGAVNICLLNGCPVKGVQFKLNGCDVLEVVMTDRTEGFFAQYNKASGAVIVVGLSGRKIEPGSGPICRLVVDDLCQGSYLTDIDIVDY